MKENRIASVVFCLFALTYFALAFTTIAQPSVLQILGPDAFPKAIGVLMLILSGVYVLQSFRGLGREDETRAAIIGAEDKVGTHIEWKTIALMLGVMLVYVFLFEPLGYPIATFLMFVTGAAILDRRHWKRDTLIAAVASFGFYFTFSLVLRVQLPAGPLRWLGL
ncbi:MAG: tripartite tricarboxylate transporter TctB family protein [Chloroflexi bacterium]|nr:tripartite tricarboxylate transporter TctB family protein [Chloroflexota bacterium]